MVRAFLITFSLLIVNIIYSQQKGTVNIIYSQSVFWNIEDSTKYDKEQYFALKNAMDKKTYFILKTNFHESIYKNEPKINNSLPSSDLDITFSNSENYIYINFLDSISITEETYPKKFFIKEKLPNYDWNLTEKTKKYKDFEINLATSIINGYKIDAWYTNSIEIRTGPKNFWGLPGLILIVEITHQKSGEKTQILMESINYEDTDYSIKPKIKKGLVVSREYYNRILENHIKKENELYGLGVDTE